MKIIFLDIDGVLNSEREAYEGERYRLDRAAILRLNAIAERTGAQIVLTSDWRRYHGLQRCIEILYEHGLRAEVIDATPNLETRKTLAEDDVDPTEYFARLRRREIEAWIESRDVHRFVVVDDLAVFERAHLSMVQTDANTGLTEDDALRISAILGPA